MLWFAQLVGWEKCLCECACLGGWKQCHLLEGETCAQFAGWFVWRTSSGWTRALFVGWGVCNLLEGNTRALHVGWAVCLLREGDLRAIHIGISLSASDKPPHVPNLWAEKFVTFWQGCNFIYPLLGVRFDTLSIALTWKQYITFFSPGCEWLPCYFEGLYQKISINNIRYF